MAVHGVAHVLYMPIASEKLDAGAYQTELCMYMAPLILRMGI